MSTPKEDALAELNTLIRSIITGGAIQSHTINGRDMTRYSLGELLQYKRSLMKDIALENSGTDSINHGTFGNR